MVRTSIQSSSVREAESLFVRRAARTFEQVVELVAIALELFTPQECTNVVRHCGSRVATGL
jgi:hypothetical protein